MSIDFTCPNCGQFYSVDDDMAGCPAECEDCGAQFDVPSPEDGKPADSVPLDPAEAATVQAADSAPAPAPDDAARPRQSVVKLKSSLDIDIERSGMTISQFMSKHGIEGGVTLADSKDSKAGTTASDVLTSKDGRKYDVGKLVAKGGMGAILSAKDLNIRRRVAMKVMLNPKEADDADLVVLDEQRLVGIATPTDVIRLLAGARI